MALCTTTAALLALLGYGRRACIHCRHLVRIASGGLDAAILRRRHRRFSGRGHRVHLPVRRRRRRLRLEDRKLLFVVVFLDGGEG